MLTLDSRSNPSICGYEQAEGERAEEGKIIKRKKKKEEGGGGGEMVM